MTVAVVPLILHSPAMTAPVLCCVAMHFEALAVTVAVQVVPADIWQLVPCGKVRAS